MEGIVSVFRDNLPWVWVAVTIICVVIESLTLSLTTIWFGISAFVMVFLAFTPLPSGTASSPLPAVLLASSRLHVC